MSAADNVTPLPQPSVKRVRRSPERYTRMREPEDGPDSVRLIGAVCGVCEAIEEMLVAAGHSDLEMHNRTVRLAAAAAILSGQLLSRVD